MLLGRRSPVTSLDAAAQSQLNWLMILSSKPSWGDVAQPKAGIRIEGRMSLRAGRSRRTHSGRPAGDDSVAALNAKQYSYG